MNLFPEWRETSQIPAPVNHFPATNDHYNLYPGFPIGPNKISSGYDALAKLLARERHVILDGYGGVFWENFRTQLNSSLLQLGVRAAWMNMETTYRPVEEIERLVADFIDSDDPLFGTLFTGEMQDFVDPERLRPLRPDPDADLSVLYGCGAALAEWDGLLVYIDLPKNEIQFRSRARAICNLGCVEPTDSKAMYKRFYFVDWAVLNRYKSGLLECLDLIVDEQHPRRSAAGQTRHRRDELLVGGRWHSRGPHRPAHLLERNRAGFPAQSTRCQGVQPHGLSRSRGWSPARRDLWTQGDRNRW